MENIARTARVAWPRPQPRGIDQSDLLDFLIVLRLLDHWRLIVR
jgi:hypothetical protein